MTAIAPVQTQEPPIGCPEDFVSADGGEALEKEVDTHVTRAQHLQPIKSNVS